MMMVLMLLVAIASTKRRDNLMCPRPVRSAYSVGACCSSPQKEIDIRAVEGTNPAYIVAVVNDP